MLTSGVGVLKGLEGSFAAIGLRVAGVGCKCT